MMVFKTVNYIPAFSVDWRFLKCSSHLPKFDLFDSWTRLTLNITKVGKIPGVILSVLALPSILNISEYVVVVWSCC